MRRWMFMAALNAILFGVPLWGQRGGHGGMAMGAPRGGYVAHGGGFVGASHGGYWGGGFHRPPAHLPYYPKHYPYFRYRSPWWGYRGFHTYPWWLGWGGIGFVGSDPSFSDPAESNPAFAYPAPDNSRAYEQQQEIDRLNDEVARLRAEREPTNPTLESSPKSHAETVLVFRDRHREEILNYAIAGGTLWVFAEQRARKIPIAELDVSATTKANADRGIDFRLPGQ